MSSAIYGIVEAVFVLGMIIGGLVVTFKPKLFKMKNIHKTMYPMIFAIMAMAIATYLTTENKLTVLAIYSISGLFIMLSLALSNVVSLTYIQSEVKEDMLGRVSALSTAIATATVGPGQLVYGQLIDLNFKLSYILAISFLLSIIVVIFVKWNANREEQIKVP